MAFSLSLELAAAGEPCHYFSRGTSFLPGGFEEFSNLGLMKKIVIAPDSFKGNLSSAQVALALERGVRRVLPRVRCVRVPMADGGEGTVQVLLAAGSGKWARRRVTGPTGRPVTARYGLLPDATAVIEMAEASGLALVEGRERNPLHTTTYGTGELIRDALDRGARSLIVGIGGSATVDGGAGMAQALGARLFDVAGRELRRPASGGMLHRVARVDVSGLDRRLRGRGRVPVTVACDVDNPLCGRLGAARIFGPQKGAGPRAVERLDRNLRHFARLLKRDLGRDVLRRRGSGGAGGLGAGLIAFARARVRSGVAIVIERTGLEEELRGADLVMTGEGRIDAQTPFGKTPAGVARAARRQRVPVIAIGGALADDARDVFAHGIDGLGSAAARDMTLDEALARSHAHLANAAERCLRLVLLGARSQHRRNPI